METKWVCTYFAKLEGGEALEIEYIFIKQSISEIWDMESFKNQVDNILTILTTHLPHVDTVTK